MKKRRRWEEFDEDETDEDGNDNEFDLDFVVMDHKPVKPRATRNVTVKVVSVTKGTFKTIDRTMVE